MTKWSVLTSIHNKAYIIPISSNATNFVLMFLKNKQNIRLGKHLELVKMILNQLVCRPIHFNKDGLIH